MLGLLMSQVLMPAFTVEDSAPVEGSLRPEAVRGVSQVLSACVFEALPATGRWLLAQLLEQEACTTCEAWAWPAFPLLSNRLEATA